MSMSVLPSSVTIRPSASPSIRPSPVSALIPTTPSGPEKVFYGYFKNLTTSEGVLVSALFSHMNLQESARVEIQSVNHSTWSVVVGGRSSGSLLATERVRLLTYSGFVGMANISFSLANSSELLTLIALVPPPQPSVSFNQSVLNVTILEDSRCTQFDIESTVSEVKHNLTSVTRLLQRRIDRASPASRENIQKFLTEGAASMRKRVAFAVKSVCKLKGRWRMGNGRGRPNEEVTTSVTSITKSTSFCLEPYDDVTGRTSIVLQVGIKDGGEFVGPVSELTVRVLITNTNDAPIIGGRAFRFPIALPYTYANITGEGTSVQSILTNVRIVDTDTDKSLIGIAIVRTEPSSIGEYQFKCNDTWVSANVSNSNPLGRSDFVDVVLLPPAAKLKFHLASNQFYTLIEATRKASLTFLAWDGTNGGVCGAQQVNTTIATTGKFLSTFRFAARLTQLRKGCDGRPGTVAVFDACGRCGGDNSTCLGCDGVINSGATHDICGVCYGGNTGRNETVLDCAGRCNTSYVDTSCGVSICQKHGFPIPRDCNNDCFGRARYNKCGACVLGNTGRTVDHWKDACGKCNGTNSTCQDCAGVPNGLSVRDLCGNCKLPSDGTFNTGCGTKLGDIKPRVAYAPGRVGGGEAVVVEVEASDLAGKTVSCKFDTTNATSSVIVGGKIMTTTTTTLGSGTYNVTCSVSGTESTARQQLHLINEDMQVTGVTPSITLKGEAANLTISGTNFLQTAELKCFYGSTNYELRVLSVSSSAIVCHLPKSMARPTGSKDVILSFAAFNRTQYLKKTTHHIGLNTPFAQSAKFSRKLNMIRLQFSGRGRVLDGSTCADVFPHNYTAFGTQASCFFQGNVLVISLLGAPTIGLGNLHLNGSSIRSLAETSIYDPNYASQTLVVQAPPGHTAPRIRVKGSRFIGTCADINLDIRIVGGDPGRLTYSWSVEWSDGSNSSNLNAVKQQLNSVSGRKVVIPSSISAVFNKKFKFSATVTTFLGASSNATIEVTRQQKTLPRVTLSATEISSKVSKAIKIRARSKVSACLDTSSMNAQLSYTWELNPSVGITLPGTSFPALVIPEGQLTGGKTYIAKVVVSMAEDTSIFVEASATITTISSALQARIRGPSTVATGSRIRLRSTGTRDPDGNKENKPVSYKWTILNMDDSIVVVNQKRIVFDGLSNTTISLDTTGLTAGQKYKFTMTYRVGIREAIATHIVDVLDCQNCSPPELSFTTTDTIFNPSAQVTLSADIGGGMDGTYEWSCVSVDDAEAGNKNYGCMDLVQGTTVITKVSGNFKGTKNVALRLKKNLLRGGVYYRLKLTATSSGTAAETTYDIQTNSVPSKGLFSVSPTTGTALNTTFVMSATSGWSDPDEDDLSFEFWYSNKGVRSLLRGASSDDSHSAQLPPGNITVIVRCLDVNGGFSEATFDVTVAPPATIDTAALTASLDTLLGEQNMESIVALANMLSDAAEAGGAESDDVKNLKKSMATSMADDKASVQSQDQKDNIQDGLSKTTAGGGGFYDPASIQKIFDFAKFLLGVASGGGRRRRRNVQQNVDVVLKTPTQVESALKIYSNLIVTSDYDSNAMTNKQDLLDSLDSLTASMCKGFVEGQDAGIATNPLVDILTVVKDLSDASTASIALNSPASGAEVVLGGVIQSQYSSYSCGDSTCAGACVSSWEMKSDLLSTSANSSLLSSIFRIKLWDPAKQQMLAENSLSSGGMAIDIIGRPTNNTYLCHTWDSVSKKWVLDGVTTVKEEISVGANPVAIVTCNVTKMVEVALFEGPPRPDPTTAAPSTSAANVTDSVTTPATSDPNATTTAAPSTAPPATTVTTTLAPDDIPHIISFKLDYPLDNCTRKLNQSGTAFRDSIREQVASAAGTSTSAMQDFNVTCGSIDIIFKLTSFNGTSVAAAMKNIEDKVKAGTLQVTIDGMNITADPTSFTAVRDPAYPTPKPKVTESDDDLSAGAIVGIVIAVIAFVVIIIVVVYVCCVKKNSRKGTAVGPKEDVELKGRSNDAYTDYP